MTPIKAGPAAVFNGDLGVEAKSFSNGLGYTTVPEVKNLDNPEGPVIVVLAHVKNSKGARVQQDLYRAGFNVKTAGDKQEAVQKIVGNIRFDPIIVLDSHLDNRDGDKVKWSDMDDLMDTLELVETRDAVVGLRKVLLSDDTNNRWDYDRVLPTSAKVPEIVDVVEELAKGREKLFS